MEEKVFIIKRGFSDNAARELIFNEKFLKFEDKDITNNAFTTFQENEIKEYRFGIRWIRFELTYGREYQIFIRNNDNKTIKITFKSYFGRKKSILNNQFNEIIDNLWNYYFSDIVDEFIKKYNNGDSFTIGDVQFSKENISLNLSGILKEKRTEIAWDNIRTKNYYTYFSIYSTENPAKINRGYSYQEDWNTSVLYSVLRTILRTKKIETYE